MTSRRKRHHLTLIEKYKLILLMEKGENRKIIAQKFNVSEAALYPIYAQSEYIKDEYKRSTSSFRHSVKRLPPPRMAEVDKIVFHWYNRCKERDVAATGADIKKKAIEVNEKLNGHPGFKASNNWLLNFKQRNNIRKYKKASATLENSEVLRFSNAFKELLDKEGITLNNVYNVAYTEMIWKAGPEGTPISSSRNLRESLETRGDYVTALFCTNSTGCHMFPVLIIGNVPESECLCNLDPEITSTIYRYKSVPCMDNTIFINWFTEYFIDFVKDKQQRENRSREKFLLLLNNSSSRYDLAHLNAIDPFVTVISPPDRIALCIQPMYCGIIETFKRRYRTELLKAIAPLPMDNAENEMINRHTAISMWDCCRIVQAAWLNISPAVLMFSWENILRHRMIQCLDQSDTWHADACKVLQILERLPGCNDCTVEQVSSWFEMDNVPDTIMRICTDAVLHEFRNNTLCPVDRDNTDDQAGPSHS